MFLFIVDFYCETFSYKLNEKLNHSATLPHPNYALKNDIVVFLFEFDQFGLAEVFLTIVTNRRNG